MDIVLTERHKKTTLKLNVESYVYLGSSLRTIVWETESQITVRNCSKEVKGGVRLCGSFC